MTTFNHAGVTYQVAPLTGWQTSILNGLCWDVFKILAFNAGVKYDDLDRLVKYSPTIILQSRIPFTQFCLTTKGGAFEDYNITKLQNVVDMYNIWLDLFASDGFYEKWIEAYLIENKEVTDPDNQKKETSIG